MGLKLATLAYVRRGGQTLMLERAARPGDVHAGRFNGLGGKFEPGESPEACLRREVLEESGLVVEEARLRGFLTFPDFDGVDDWYAFVYLVTRFRGEPRASAEGALHWIDTERVPALPLWPGDRVFLPWLDGEALFSATLRYRGGRFEGHEVAFYAADGRPLEGPGPAPG